jgi:hypothetical protein
MIRGDERALLLPPGKSEGSRGPRGCRKNCVTLRGLGAFRSSSGFPHSFIRARVGVSDLPCPHKRSGSGERLRAALVSRLKGGRGVESLP